MKLKSPEQAVWEAECKRLLKKIVGAASDEKAKQFQEQYRVHRGSRPKPFLPGLRFFGDTSPDGHPNSPAYGHLKLPHLN